jgi:predicted DCC family thiol-disulfide oxidoreductase YuxK
MSIKIENLPVTKKIILFDGYCNLCDSSVQWIIKRDKKDQFRFVSLQSELGQLILDYLHIKVQHIDSIILYEPQKAYYYKANAVFEIGKTLGGLYYSVSLFSVLPNILTNKIYDYIAKNRYRWFGEKENCMLPTDAIKSKFLS